MMDKMKQELIEVGEEKSSADHKLFMSRIHFSNNANMPPFFKNRVIGKSVGTTDQQSRSQSEKDLWQAKSAKLQS